MAMMCVCVEKTEDANDELTRYRGRMHTLWEICFIACRCSALKCSTRYPGCFLMETYGAPLEELLGGMKVDGVCMCNGFEYRQLMSTCLSRIQCLVIAR